MPEFDHSDRAVPFLRRDPVSAILFGVAVILTAFFAVAGIVFARTGDPGLLKAALLSMGAFAVVGIAFGLARTLGGRR